MRDMLADAAAIFAQTRSAVASVAYPPSLAYSIVVSGVDGSVNRTNHYRAIVNTETGNIRVRQVSDEEAAAPVTPHGVNTAFTFTICIFRSGCGGRSIPVGPPQGSPDLLGVPLLSPTYDFGIIAPNSAHRSNVDATLPVIATVASSRKDYDVTLIGSEALNGEPTIHLALRPLHDAHKYRLRDLWINPATYLPERAIVAGNFTAAGMADVPWTIDFKQIGSLWYVAKETPLTTLYLPHRQQVRNATIAFENIVATDEVYGPALVPDSTSDTLVEP